MYGSDPIAFTADITGSLLRSVWDFGDGTVVTNQCFIRHAWALPGTYTVRLTGYNDGHPEGVATSLEVTVSDPTVHYVNAANAAPVFPYTTWETAATNVQDAVDAGILLGRWVLVTNGVYRAGAVGGLTFSVRDFTDLPSLASKLREPTRPVDAWLVTQLSAATVAALGAYAGEGSDPTPLARALVQDLNRLVNEDWYY